MEFTCPHCGKPFEQKVREGSTSAKANAARKRNGALGGGQQKATQAQLEQAYANLCMAKKPWTWADFRSLIQRKTGVTYSRAQVYVILNKLKMYMTDAGEIRLERFAKRLPDGEAVNFIGGSDKPITKPEAASSKRKQTAK